MRIDHYLISLKWVGFLWVVLLIGSCSDQEDSIPNKIYEISLPDVIHIESNLENLQLNDTLWVTIVVPNELDYEGSSISIAALTLRETVGMSFKLEKEDGFSIPSLIRWTPSDLTYTQGDAAPSPNDSSRILVNAVLEDNQFKARFGLILRSRGNYLFSPFVAKDQGLQIVFSDLDFQTGTIDDVLIYTTFENGDSQGNLIFEVE